MELEKNLVLPDWMKPFVKDQRKDRLSKIPFETITNVGLSSGVRTKPEKNSSTCKKFYEVAQFCEKLLYKADANPLVLGLDLDWPSTYKSVFKTKQIHLCCGENECGILFVSEFDTIPKAFTLLVTHTNVHLVGYDIRKDLIKLGKDFSLNVSGLIAKLEDPVKYVDHKLSCIHHWSIKSVAEKGLDSPAEEPEPEKEQFKFKGLINFTNTINDCGAVCEKLLKIVDYFPRDENLVFGFDVEWPFTYKSGPGNGKVALIQMCPEERVCFLFHVASFKSLPKSLVLLLNHPHVRLSGLNIANDIRKLGRDFKIDVANILQHRIIELCTLANKTLNISQRWSLDGLVLNQLNMVLEKPKDVRISNWADIKLKKEQITYAASDAYASLAVYNNLMGTISPNILSLLY